MRHRTPPTSRMRPGVRFRAWLSYFLLAFAILFAVLNLDEVEVDWIIGTWQTPLLVVILVSFALGCAAGWIAARRWRAR